MLRVSSQPQRLSRPMLQKLSRSISLSAPSRPCNSLLFTSNHASLTMQHIDRAGITPIAIALHASKHAFRSIHSQPPPVSQVTLNVPVKAAAASAQSLVPRVTPTSPSKFAAFTSPILVSPWMPTSFSNRHLSSQAFHPRDRVKAKDAAADVAEKVKEAEIVQSSSSASSATSSVDQNANGATAATSSADGVSVKTAADEVLTNPGLSSFMGRVYRTTGASFAASMGLSYLFAGAATAVVGAGAGSAVLTTMAIGGGITSIITSLILMLSKPPPTVTNSENQLVTYNPTWRKLTFGTFLVSNAVLISPLVVLANVFSPFIVPAAVGAAALTMGGASWYAYKQPSSSLLSWSAPLTGALVGMVGMQLAAAATFFMIGPNVFSAAMMTVQPYVGIALFSLLTAFDTHYAIAEYKAGNADHLVHAVSFYLNFINLLIDFIRIIVDSVVNAIASV